MPYTTVVPSTTITAAWGNANVRDQVVTPFASAAARTSAITSPVNGMVSYLQDVGRLEINNGSAWAPLPGAQLAWGNRPSASSTTTSEVGVLRLDNIPVVSGMSYRIWTGPLYLLTTASDTVRAAVRVSTSGAATTSSTSVGNGVQLVSNNIQPPSGVLIVKYDAVATGTLSVLLTVARTAGTGSVSITVGGDLLVECLGPTLTDTGVDI